MLAAMSEPPRKISYTFAEYLALEAKSATKHELVNGEIFAMAGGTPEHGRLSVNVQGELRNALRGRPCAVFNSDVRVRVQATGLGTYPDATVVCGRLAVDPEDKNTIVNPVVLVEVLSDSTELYDRDDERAHYRQIPTLRDYLLVSQHERRVDHYHRNDGGTWTLRDVRAGGEIRLDAIACKLSVDAVYEDPLAPPATPPARAAGTAKTSRSRPRRPVRGKRA